ncbi:MAG TPA: DUF924 family protein [Azospirillaceae bacterium]|nr:DUF924 family protein [Azospirillaceae bacterium]
MSDPQSVLDFWFSDAAKPMWFAKSDAFDAEVRRRFQSLHEAAAAGELDAWKETAEGCLALVILLDQVPRNIFRGSPRAYATDEAARDLTWHVLDRGFDWEFPDIDRRLFFYLPLEHSEDLDDQETCVRLFEERTPDPEYIRYGRQHRDIIARFGRFPHRNVVLGRESTPEELEFLKGPNSSF